MLGPGAGGKKNCSLKIIFQCDRTGRKIEVFIWNSRVLDTINEKNG